MNEQNKVPNEDEGNNAIVTPETIEIFTGFATGLKRIHVRLVMEGYTITEGKIYKPGEKLCLMM